MKEGTVDLHVHTNESDGEFPPEETVQLGMQAGLKAMAITDHDTVSGCQRAINAAQGKLEIIPGMEISCSEKQFGPTEVHVLGLFLDIHNQRLLDYCQRMYDERIIQKKKMIQKLKSFGYDITFEEAIKLAGHSFGRPHVAQIMVKKYPQEFPNVRSVFDKHLGNGKPAFVERENKTSIKQAVELIRQAGGISILAHPGVYEKENGLQMIDYFSACGGNGVETHYCYDRICGVSVEDSKEWNRLFQARAKELGLLESGGSDFHGSIRKTVVVGQLDLPYELVQKLKSKLGQSK